MDRSINVEYWRKFSNMILKQVQQKLVEPSSPHPLPNKSPKYTNELVKKNVINITKRLGGKF